MVSFAITLASVVFVGSVLSIVLNYPTKKLLRWFRALIVSTQSVNGSVDVSDQKSALVKERSVEVVEEKRGGGRGFDERRRMLFSTFDRNGDGFITRQELRDSLRGIRIFMSEEEVDEIVARSDGNGDGLIDFGEFCKLLEDSEVGFGSEGSLKEAFDVFDKDKDGLISVEELGSVMCSLGLINDGGKKVEDCKEMIRKVDMDGDGMVNFDEFKRMMTPANGGKPIFAY